MPPWSWALVSCLVLGAMLFCQQRWVQLFPEDQPGTQSRKQHPWPTPLVGWSLGLLSLCLSWGWWWLMCAIALATYAGYQDDCSKSRPRHYTAGERRDYPWQKKGLLLLAAAVCAAAHLRELHPGLGAGEMALALLLLFVVGNAANFLDNTNGVTASLAGLGLLWASGGEGSMAAIGWLCLGFLPWNWPVARAFLGDSAALPLGICLGTAALDHGLQRDGTLGLGALLPMAVFLVDFVQVVTARLVIGVAPWVGDRRHLTHVLQHHGLPAILVAPLLCAAAFAIQHYGQQLIAQ